jgi:hypothetical protein
MKGALSMNTVRSPRVRCGAILFACLIFMAHARGERETAAGEATVDAPTVAASGRVALPPPEYDLPARSGRYGLGLDLGWSGLSWKLNGISSSKRTFSPQATLFFHTTPNMEVFLSASQMAATDRFGGQGKIRADILQIGAGVGYAMRWSEIARLWPVAGVGAGYCVLDAKMNDTNGDRLSVSVDDGLSGRLYGGAEALVANSLYARIALEHERLLNTSDASVDGRPSRFEMQATRLVLGLRAAF